MSTGDRVREFCRAARYVGLHWVLRREQAIAPARHFGLEFRVRLADNQGRHIFKRGEHEPDATRFLLSHLRFEPGDVIFDVGANIGWYSTLLDRLAPAGAEVFSFEPHPGNFSLLADNLRRNRAGKVHPKQLALSDRAGRLTMYLYKRSNFGRHSLLPINTHGEIEIEATTLDAFWDSQGLGTRPLKFMKMDIEGYELTALRGAAGTLARCQFLMIEYSPGLMGAAGIEPRQLLEVIAASGLVPHRLEGGALQPVAIDELAASQAQVNLFCTRP